MNTYEIRYSDGTEDTIEAESLDRRGGQYEFTADEEIVAEIQKHTVDRVVRVDARVDD